MEDEPNVVLFRGEGEIKCGDTYRYQIEYTPMPDMTHTSIYVYVYNMEVSPLRAAYLQGPFTLYVDMRPERYDDLRHVRTPADQPHYNHNLKAGQHFKCELLLKGAHKHVWYVDVVGEQLFNRNAVIRHQLVVATSKTAAKSSAAVGGDPRCEAFKVNVKDTQFLWMDPAERPDKPLHLVLLTHGLMSNVTADMLYLKEEIDKQALRAGENVICKGYTGNVCRTEKGVKYLGTRVADWIMHEMIPRYKPKKLSFIAHSLGGLTQTYALGYIHAKDPNFFDGIELVNFVCLASPLLGISTENPGLVKMVLDFGFVGKTGRDLGLSWQLGTRKPLLKTLPTGPAHVLLERFENRTLYANAVNDGIVPLRTASLLYLDWRAISKATAARRGSNAARFESANHPDNEVASLDGYEKEDVPKSKQKEKHFSGGSTGSTHTVNTITNTMDQVFNWLNPWAPPRVSRHKLAHYQTKPHASDESASDDDADENEHGEDHVQLPKKTSIIESGMALMIAPLPNHEFIGDPSKREDVIFHDRIYDPEDLPPKRTRKSTLFRSHDDPKEIARSEERMARAWHKDKTWRKVLVQLLPEAHNNIVVRRRFTNAYGWPVVHHLVTTHFPEPAPEVPTLRSAGDKSAPGDTPDAVPSDASSEASSEQDLASIGANLEKVDLRPAESGIDVEGPGELDLSKAQLSDADREHINAETQAHAERDREHPDGAKPGPSAATPVSPGSLGTSGTLASSSSHQSSSSNSDIDVTWFDPSVSDSEQSEFYDARM